MLQPLVLLKAPQSSILSQTPLLRTDIVLLNLIRQAPSSSWLLLFGLFILLLMNFLNGNLGKEGVLAPEQVD